MSSTTTLPAPAPAVPLLRDGEAMTREEFERRWDTNAKRQEVMA